MEFELISNGWLPISFEESEDDKLTAYFTLNNERFNLDDFINLKNNLWIPDADYPEYIHGVEMISPDHQIGIEVSDSLEQVRVYRCK